jgi:Ca2+-binding RTX toxin-like protein
VLQRRGDDQRLTTNGDDVIFGSDGDDVIRGNGGNDIIYGDDTACTGAGGNDTIRGDAGNDDLDDTCGIIVAGGGSGRDSVSVTGTAKGGSGHDFSISAYDDLYGICGGVLHRTHPGRGGE